MSEQKLRAINHFMQQLPEMATTIFKFKEAVKRSKMKTFTCAYCGAKSTCSAEDVEYTVHNEGWHYSSDGKEYCYQCGKAEWTPSDNFPAAHIAAMKQFLDIENAGLQVDFVNDDSTEYTVFMDRRFDTKQEAEYFISLLKAFCK